MNERPRHGEYRDPSNYTANQNENARSQRPYMNERPRHDEDYAPPSRPKELKNEMPHPEKKGKRNLANIGLRYGKISVVVLLSIIILFLLFYLFSQNQLNEIGSIQNPNGQIVKPATEHLYPIEKFAVDLKTKEVFMDMKTPIYAIKRKDKLNIEKIYEPKLIVEKLM